MHTATDCIRKFLRTIVEASGMDRRKGGNVGTQRKPVTGHDRIGSNRNIHGLYCPPSIPSVIKLTLECIKERKTKIG